jgi:tetratricopeptide (TPR) repeat protein
MASFTRAHFSWGRIAPLAFAAIFTLAVSAARAQDPTKPPPPPPATPPAQSNGQAPPPGAGESSSRNTPDGLRSSPPPPPSKTSGLPGDAEALPAFNPLEAEKDVEVGRFYLKQGKYDAAIDRFKDASVAVPTYALPWQLMGEAYEKKGDLADSIKAYQKYLRLYPHAPERKKIEDHIVGLQKKLEEQPQKQAKE